MLDGAVAIGAQLLGAVAGGLEPVGAVRAAQAHQAEAGAIALLGMRPTLEDAGDEAARGRAASARPTRSGATGVHSAWARCELRHVLDLRREPAASGEPRGGTRRAGPSQKTSTRAGGRARLDLLVHELVRHAVEVVVDLDVVVDVDATRLPLRQLVALAGKRPERRAIELLEERAPAHADRLHRPVVDGVERSRIAALSSASAKKVRWRSAARIQRWAIWTLDLDFGLVLRLRRRRAGITTAP